MFRFLAFSLLAVFVSSCVYTKNTKLPTAPEGAVLESRGVWLTKNEMLRSKEDLLALLDKFQEANINTVYVHTQLRGFVMYPGGELVPQWKEMAEHDRNIFDWLIPAIHERGMKAEAWMEYGLYAYWTPDVKADPSRGPILKRYPDLVAIDADGNEYLHNEKWGDYYSLCPTNPKTHEVIIDLNDEVLGLYPFDGVNLDRIRFASLEYCFCPHCKELFEKDTGLELRLYDAGTIEAGVVMQWRKDQLHQFMGKFSDKIRGSHPGIVITAAVMPPYMIDEKGQDWVTWIQAGYIDAGMPMLYLEDIEEEVDIILDRAGADAMVFHGLDAAANDEAAVLNQIEYLHRIDAPGIALWESGSIEKMLPALKQGPFATPAVSPIYYAGKE